MIPRINDPQVTSGMENDLVMIGPHVTVISMSHAKNSRENARYVSHPFVQNLLQRLPRSC